MTMISIDAGDISAIVRANRASLDVVPHWITDFDYEHSIFNYGLPGNVRHLIDAPMGDELTYTDLLAFVGSAFDGVRYLEIGVSVGKNFLQLMRFFKQACLVGVDIEDMNPVLERFLVRGGRKEWPTPIGSIRHAPSTATEYQYAENRNLVRYIAGDVFDDQTWLSLSGCSFNLVFSDAFHSGEALLREWGLLRNLDLLDRSEFAMIWDDLGEPSMQHAFFQIAREMQDEFAIPSHDIGMMECRGWLGINEGHHPIGVVRKVRTGPTTAG